METLFDLAPLEAVAEARRQKDDSRQAVDKLDRYLKVQLLDFLQNRVGNRSELGGALIAARTWALREGFMHVTRWELLLEILEDSRRMTSRAEQLDLTESASEILREIIAVSKKGRDLRPKELARKLGKTEQNINNYLKRLESQDLIIRRKLPGRRAAFVFPTRTALDLFGSLPSPTPGTTLSPSAQPLGEEIPLWHLGA